MSYFQQTCLDNSAVITVQKDVTKVRIARNGFLKITNNCWGLEKAIFQEYSICKMWVAAKNEMLQVFLVGGSSFRN